MVGKTISQYRIVDKLGQGGMGVVYRAEDVKLHRFVAIKMLPYEIGADEEQKARFLQEARAASAIDHPNIGAIYEIDETPDGDLFIAMAYYEGETLRERIRRGELSLDEALGIGGQIARGMERAHARGIIHRDLKPANIIITPDGTVKIIDFGLAKFVAGAQLTRTGVSVGTVAYMSPEQINSQAVDARSDIWALGVILHEMLTGEHPFRGDFETALLYSIANDSPTPTSERRAGIPEYLSQLISRCLEKDPAKRVQQMSEIAPILSPSPSSHSGVPGVLSVASGTAPRGAASRVFRKTPTVFVAATVLLLAGAWYAWRFMQGPGSAPSAGESLSLAVLPLANHAEAEQQYYADGLTEDIREELSKLPRLLVISRVSSSLYGGPNADLHDISRNLGARFVLRGGFQLLPAKMLIELTLYDADASRDVWKETYDVLRKDLLTAKISMLRAIAAKLGLPPDRFVQAGVSADVYDLYLQGIYYRDKSTKEASLLAGEYFSEAVQKDSTYVPGVLNLAGTKIESARRGWTQSEQELSDAERLCNKVAADSASPWRAQVLALLGGIASQRGHAQEALGLLLRAIDLDRNNAAALTEAALLYMYRLGDPVKAVPLLKRLEGIDPENALYLSNLGVAYAEMKNYAEAIKMFKQASEMDPSNPFSFTNTAYAYERLGRYDSAVAYYSTALRKAPSEAQTYESLASVLFATGKVPAAESILATGARLLQSNMQVLYAYGIARSLTGKPEEARRIFEAGIQIANFNIRRNEALGENFAYQALFYARLGNGSAAISAIGRALARDSTAEETLIKAARTYSILGRKKLMIEFFSKARAANPEYDLPYLGTALDFEKYRTDPDLLLAARMQ